MRFQISQIDGYRSFGLSLRELKIWGSRHFFSRCAILYMMVKRVGAASSEEDQPLRISISMEVVMWCWLLLPDIRSTTGAQPRRRPIRRIFVSRGRAVASQNNPPHCWNLRQGNAPVTPSNVICVRPTVHNQAVEKFNIAFASFPSVCTSPMTLG